MGTREPLAAATSCVGVSEGLSELARIPECGDGRGNPFAVNPPELAVDKPCYCYESLNVNLRLVLLTRVSK
jgi:hypothetical protein